MEAADFKCAPVRIMSRICRWPARRLAHYRAAVARLRFQGCQMHPDARGLVCSSRSANAVAHFDATIGEYLGFGRATGEHLKAALAADPDFVLAHRSEERRVGKECRL